MKRRDSKFEIIRILSMIFIVAYHYTMYGDWQDYNSVKIQFFRPFGQVGVALFVMITGYFLAQKETTFTNAWHHIDKLWVKTLIYSWVILCCALIFHWGKFYKRDFLYAIFPVIFDEYWFITSYIVLILLTPLLNIPVRIFSKRDFFILIGIILIFADIVPFIKNDGTPNAPLGNMLSVGAMLAPYFIAGFIRKYNFKVKTWQACFVTMGGLILEYSSMLILKHGIIGLDIANFTFGLCPLITAIGIFLVFLNLPSFNSRIINRIASGVLATYLITEHPLFRIYFWHNLLHVNQFQYPFWKFVLMGILIAVMTVIICSFVDNVYEVGRKSLYFCIRHIHENFYKRYSRK